MEAVLWDVFELGINAFECFIFVRFLTEYLGTKYSGVRQWGSFWGAFALMFFELSLINQVVPFEMASSILAVLLLTLYARLFLKGSWVLQLFLAGFSQVVIACAMIGSNLLISATFQISAYRLVNTSGIFRLIFVISGNLLFFSIMQLVLKVKQSGALALRDAWVLLINPTLSVLSLCCIMEMAMLLPPSDIFPMMAVIITVVMNIFTYKMFLDAQRHSENTLKLELLQLQQKNQQKSIEQSREALKDISTMKHDMKNTNLVLLSYLESGKIDEAVGELKRQNSLIDAYNRQLYTSNAATDGMLRYKAEEAQSRGIALEVDVLINELGGVDEAECCVMLGNLLDNAIEHVSALNPEDRKIWVKLFNDRSYLCVNVQNIIYSSVLEGNRKLRTTKPVKKHHGLGLYSVKKIVEKYDGILDIYEQGDRFCVNVALNISVK